MFEIVDDPRLLKWMQYAFRLAEKVEDGRSQTFGPFKIKKRKLNVRYDAETGDWQILQWVDVSYRDHLTKLNQIVVLAEQHRRSMEPVEFVQMLIQACIATEVVSRPAILETVDLSANYHSHQEAIDTGRDLESIPMEFSAEFVAGVLDRGRGRDPRRHLWWVDQWKIYPIH